MLRQWEETRAITAQILNSRDHMLLVDFDSHLDDITKDWTNQKLNAKITELICPANGNMWRSYVSGSRLTIPPPTSRKRLPAVPFIYLLLNN